MKKKAIIHEQVFLNGAEYFAALQNDIKNAKQSIDLETYIFYNDCLGQQIAESLIAAAQRGLEIRVLVDGAGTPNWGDQLTQRMESVGIETRVFHPFPWRLWQWSRAKIRLFPLLKPIYLLLYINKRNHRKVCIIDKKIIYVGSANICKSHLPLEQGGENWRDTAIRLVRSNTNELQTAFDAAWNHMYLLDFQDYFQDIKLNPIFRLNNSRHRRRILYKNLLRRLAKAQNRIWITNAYFVPDSFLLRILANQARIGVDVRILLPQKSDVFMLPWASTAFYEKLVKAGVKIFEYLPTMLHAKSLIIDEWFIIGSSNLNHRSLLHDLEVDILIRTPEAKLALEQQFLIDQANSKTISSDNWHYRNWWQRFIGRLLLYIKYWM